MTDKKKFVKPEMKVIKLKAKMSMLVGSECPLVCSTDTAY